MQEYNIFSSLYLLPVISQSRSLRQRLYLAPAAARKEDQTSPLTAWLPWSRLWHGRWMAPLAVRRWLSKTNESKAHQSEGETPLSSAGRLDGGEWVICYRFEYITGIDVNVSGVKAQRLEVYMDSSELIVCVQRAVGSSGNHLSLFFLFQYYWKEIGEFNNCDVGRRYSSQNSPDATHTEIKTLVTSPALLPQTYTKSSNKSSAYGHINGGWVFQREYGHIPHFCNDVYIPGDIYDSP